MNGVKKPPLTAVEESRHLGAKVFDKEHNKLTIKMAKIPKQCGFHFDDIALSNSPTGTSCC